jgi:hypothetical protein
VGVDHLLRFWSRLQADGSDPLIDSTQVDAAELSTSRAFSSGAGRRCASPHSRTRSWRCSRAGVIDVNLSDGGQPADVRRRHRRPHPPAVTGVQWKVERGQQGPGCAARHRPRVSPASRSRPTQRCRATTSRATTTGRSSVRRSFSSAACGRDFQVRVAGSS